MSHEKSPAPLAGELRSQWYRFLDTYEPLRPDLYRYCRYLTRSPWDAEDLAQDTLARAFVTLGQMGEAPASPRAWLFRVASNLWIDRQRRPRDRAVGEPADEAAFEPVDRQASREAAGTLLARLSPQERAALVLKDVFDLSLEEVAAAVGTTVGGVKAALHRGRGRLAPPLVEAGSERVAPPAALDAFCEAFNARDLDRLTALLLDTVTVEVVGITTRHGADDARRTVLTGMLFGTKILAALPPAEAQRALPDSPRAELRHHRGEWLVILFYAHEDGEAVRAVNRVALADGRISRLLNYFYTPEFITEVAAELGLPARTNGHTVSRHLRKDVS